MAEPSLQLRLAQKLALSPQLQQAIRLLQLNRIELREYIQEVLDSNPILERDEGDGAGDTAEDALAREVEAWSKAGQATTARQRGHPPGEGRDGRVRARMRAVALTRGARAVGGVSCGVVGRHGHSPGPRQPTRRRPAAAG